jgi:RNA 2',3'-cyclic 3'-phosphodiesterase
MDGLFLPPTTFDFPISKPSILSTRRLRRRHERLHRPVHRLFWAAVPDSETAGCIAKFAARERAKHGLTGKLLQTNRFHVTLHHVGDMDSPASPYQIDDQVRRATNVVMPSFRVAFDRAQSFRNGAFVLAGDDGVIGLDVLHQRLNDELDWQPRPARRFTPHMTLLYDRQRIEEQLIEPITWTVREIVLVESLVGQTIHRHLARIPLASGGPRSGTPCSHQHR